jgi:hypothetical protein
MRQSKSSPMRKTKTPLPTRGAFILITLIFAVATQLETAEAADQKQPTMEDPTANDPAGAPLKFLEHHFFSYNSSHYAVQIGGAGFNLYQFNFKNPVGQIKAYLLPMQTA